MGGCQREENLLRCAKEVEGSKSTNVSYKIKKPWVCNLQNKEYNQEYHNYIVWGHMVARFIVAIIS